MAVLNILSFLLIFPCLAFGQDIRKIKIEAKTINPKESYHFIITKTSNEIKVVYNKVDSIGKMDLSQKDLAIWNNIKLHTSQRNLKELPADSIIVYQNQLDSLLRLQTFYKSDSTSVYETTHNGYWKLVETIFKTPNVILQKKYGQNDELKTLYLITLQYGVAGADRRIQIDSTDQKVFPLLGKLFNNTEAIIKAHQKVMERKNQ